MLDYSAVTAEAELEAVRSMAEAVAGRFSVRLLRPPEPAMVMVRHREPLENTPFYLGEAYVTECEVEVDGRPGYGCVLGPSEERALCAAIVDAVMGTAHPFAAELQPLLEEQAASLAARRLREARAVGSTRVDFGVR
jgi:alpha-D-ribose 1-methylphosphonate 5-triphosphate synthase subunit PhnG